MSFIYAGRYSEVFITSAGRLLHSKQVTVYDAGTTNLSTLYTDKTKGTPASNPFTTDASGNGTFFANPGDYDLAYLGTTVRVTVAVDPAEEDIDISTVTLSLPYNVKASPYNAAGDGVTNDAGAIQSAINAASSAGGTVFFPVGTYIVGSSISLKSNVRLQGAGRLVTIIKRKAGVDFGTSGVLDGNGATPIVQPGIEDLTVDGNYGEFGADYSETAGQSYVRVTSSLDAAVSAPDSAGLSITGDTEIRAKANVDDVAPNGVIRGAFYSKWLGTGNQRSVVFRVAIDGSGKLELLTSSDGINTTVTAQSTVAAPLVAGTDLWVRVTIAVDNGAAGRTIKFYTSSDTTNDPDAVVWAQLGTDVVQGTVTSIFDSTATAQVGNFTVGVAGLSGGVKVVQVRNGIGGTVVAQPTFVNGTRGQTVYTDAQGNTWTLAANTFTRTKSGGSAAGSRGIALNQVNAQCRRFEVRNCKSDGFYSQCTNTTANPSDSLLYESFLSDFVIANCYGTAHLNWDGPADCFFDDFLVYSLGYNNPPQNNGLLFTANGHKVSAGHVFGEGLLVGVYAGGGGNLQFVDMVAESAGGNPGGAGFPNQANVVLEGSNKSFQGIVYNNTATTAGKTGIRLGTTGGASVQDSTVLATITDCARGGIEFVTGKVGAGMVVDVTVHSAGFPLYLGSAAVLTGDIRIAGSVGGSAQGERYYAGRSNYVASDGNTPSFNILQNAGSQNVPLQRWLASNGTTVLSSINKSGYFTTFKNSAPADGDLATNEMAVWFDNTAGVTSTRLMIKAKDSGGTVRTGYFPLVGAPLVPAGGTAGYVLTKNTGTDWDEVWTNPAGAWAPAAHKTTHEPGGSDVLTALTNANIDAAAAIAESKLSLATDAAAGTGSRRTLGTGATQAAAGTDARFTDSRTSKLLGGTITSPVTVVSNANVTADLARFTGGLAQSVPQVGDLYLFRAFGDLLSNSGAPTYTLGLLIGTTNPFSTDLAFAPGASAVRRGWYVEARIGIASATSQLVSADWKYTTTVASWANAASAANTAVAAYGSAAENTGTGARDIALTVRMSVNNPSVDAVCRYASLQRIAA